MPAALATQASESWAEVISPLLENQSAADFTDVSW
jgi:hypothetical protein